MPRLLSRPKCEAMIAEFNRRFPLKSKVWYTSIRGGPARETMIREEAWLLPSGHPVCMVVGVSGAVSIFHVTKPGEELT